MPIIARPQVIASATVKKVQINRAVKAYWTAHNAELKAQGKCPKISRQATISKEVSLIIEKVVRPQIEQAATRFRLDLSDGLITEKTGIKTSRCNDLRTIMREMGVITMVKGSRTTKTGQYPIYLLESRFINFIPKETKKRAPRDPKNSKYVAEYEAYLDEAKAMVRKELEDSGEVLYADEYLMSVYGVVRWLVERDGLELSDLLK